MGADAGRPVLRGGDNWIFRQLILLAETLGEAVTLDPEPGSLQDLVRASDHVWELVTANFEASGRQEIEWSLSFEPPKGGFVEEYFRELYLELVFRDEIFLAEFRRESAKGRLRKVAVSWCTLLFGSDTILEDMSKSGFDKGLHLAIANMPVNPSCEKELLETVTLDEVRANARRTLEPTGTTHVVELMSEMPHRYIFVPKGNVFIDHIIEVMALSQGHDIYFVRRRPHSQDEDSDCEDCLQRMGCEQIGLRVPTHTYEAALEQYESSGARQLRDLVSDLFEAPEDTRKRLWKYLCERFELLGQYPQKNTLADVCSRYDLTPAACVILGVQQLAVSDACKEAKTDWENHVQNSDLDDSKSQLTTLLGSIAGEKWAILFCGWWYKKVISDWGPKGSMNPFRNCPESIQWNPNNPALVRLEVQLPADIYGEREAVDDVWLASYDEESWFTPTSYLTCSTASGSSRKPKRGRATPAQRRRSQYRLRRRRQRALAKKQLEDWLEDVCSSSAKSA
ncbi:hypothetical protein F5Y18DRAFT_432210 [Xylariaceae sp. FL1019]|nr:hypothetical protein F5Y18DRAFT_432210 [Xylariaceae sp. FL1019]